MNPSTPTITPEQLQANYQAMKGSSPAAQNSATPATSWDAYDQAVGNPSTQDSNPPLLDSYISKTGDNLKNTFKQGSQNVMSDIQNTPQGNNTTLGGLGKSVLGDLSTAGHIAGDIAGTAGGLIGSFISPLLPDGVKSKIGDVTKFVGDRINSIPGMTPEIAKSLGDVFNTLTLAGGNAAEPIAKEVAGQGISKVAEVGTQTLDTASNGLKKAGDAAASINQRLNPLAEKPATLQDAVEIVSPKMSAKDTANALAEGRGTGGGLLSKTKILPDKATTEIGKAVQGIVKTGVPAADNITSLRQAISSEAENLKSQIKDADHPYSFKELNSKLNAVDTPISIKGTAFEKQIGAVKKAAMSIAKDSGGTVSSLLDARKAFDSLVSKEYPNLYDSASAPMKTAITSIRNTMNDFIEENLPANLSYKDSLGKQNMYYRAIDNISEKAVGDTKTTGIGRIGKAIKAHPVGSLLGGLAADKVLKKTTGLGI